MLSGYDFATPILMIECTNAMFTQPTRCIFIIVGEH